MWWPKQGTPSVPNVESGLLLAFVREMIAMQGFRTGRNAHKCSAMMERQLAPGGRALNPCISLDTQRNEVIFGMLESSQTELCHQVDPIW